MCNLYSMTRPQDAVRGFFTRTPPADRLGNLPPLFEVFPDYAAPVVRNGAEGREMAPARWGMPTLPRHLAGKARDPGVTNIRQTGSPHWRPWLGTAHRCVVPFTAFAETGTLTDGRRGPVWFALGEELPLGFFAGLWTRWTSVRKVKEGAVTADLFGILTTAPSAEVAAVHPKAMPVILTREDEVERWLTAPAPEALRLQRPLPDGALTLVPPPGAAVPPDPGAPVAPDGGDGGVKAPRALRDRCKPIDNKVSRRGLAMTYSCVRD
jgi:putative SOS response-associated peptidase YedK